MKTREVPLSKKFHHVKTFAKWIQFTPDQWKTHVSDEDVQILTLNGSEELLKQASKAVKINELGSSQKLAWNLDSNAEEDEVLGFEYLKIYEGRGVLIIPLRR